MTRGYYKSFTRIDADGFCCVCGFDFNKGMQQQCKQKIKQLNDENLYLQVYKKFGVSVQII